MKLAWIINKVTESDCGWFFQRATLERVALGE
jgi:hypothetical protein